MEKYQVNVLLLGSSGCGKTQILNRFADNMFNESYISTYGIDFKRKDFSLDSKAITCTVYEYGGKDSFCKFHRAHVVLVCIDLTNKEEMESLDGWVNEGNRVCLSHKTKFVIGTKCDQFSKIVIHHETIRNYCSSRNISYIECSSKLNINIDDLFNTATWEGIQVVDKGPIESNNSLPRTPRFVKKKRKKNNR